ncbi:MAG: short subunit dehydrogenase-like uncharacterized protein [Halioglobus sp.]|jgi:short subunit dehydrogenase-like uncharacterized protein
MTACIKAGTHYTDITGEGPVFRIGQGLHEQAKKSRCGVDGWRRF